MVQLPKRRSWPRALVTRIRVFFFSLFARPNAPAPAGHIDQILMSDLNAQKLQLPQLVSQELWAKSGRLQNAGAELFRLQDRHEQPMCIGESPRVGAVLSSTRWPQRYI